MNAWFLVRSQRFPNSAASAIVVGRLIVTTSGRSFVGSSLSDRTRTWSCVPDLSAGEALIRAVFLKIVDRCSTADISTSTVTGCCCTGSQPVTSTAVGTLPSDSFGSKLTSVPPSCSAWPKYRKVTISSCSARSVARNVSTSACFFSSYFDHGGPKPFAVASWRTKSQSVVPCAFVRELARTSVGGHENGVVSNPCSAASCCTISESAIGPLYVRAFSVSTKRASAEYPRIITVGTPPSGYFASSRTRRNRCSARRFRPVPTRSTTRFPIPRMFSPRNRNFLAYESHAVAVIASSSAPSTVASTRIELISAL